MQKITSHLWFDKDAREAAEVYTSAFKGSRITYSGTLRNTPTGSVDVLTIELFGHEFSLISGGPSYKFTPAVSFLVACKAKDEVDALWKVLSAGGLARMELGEYPFSKWYGWIEDRYGLSWQLMLTDRPVSQKITPTLMFAGNVWGKAEEAVNRYVSVFHNSAVGAISRYGKGEEPDKEGTLRHIGFTLERQQFAAMDSARVHDSPFTEAISFVVNCEDQSEVDYYWGKLSAVPQAEICGWLKDKYGLSWQIVPIVLPLMLRDHDDERVARVTAAFLKMKKLDIAALKRAYERA